MKYLISILRIFVLVAVVLAIANFSDVKKAQAASGCTTTGTITCTISENGSIDNDGGTTPVFHLNGVITNTLPLTNKPTTITGNIIVTTYGSLTFSDLTITNGAKVTQAAILTSEVIGTGIATTLNTVGLNKKVDLTVTGTLSLTNQGKIDVSGKGFPGGGTLSSQSAGYGRGGGGGASRSGAAYGGQNIHYNGTIIDVYGSEDQPTDNGSGGSGYQYGIAGAGGGVIKIHTNNMVLDYDSQTYILANGGDSTKPKSGSYYFGGSGGSIWLQVTGALTTHTDWSYSPPSTTGNRDYTESIGYPGTVKITGTSEHFGTYIKANGGWSGGAGGRIRIEVPNVAHPTTCNITAGDVIPSYCDGQDVTVSGTTINMNKVQVKSDKTPCNNQLDSACDSKRHFTSLTVGSGAVLTHEALTYAEIKPGGKTVNRTTSTGRWKKVDIEVDNTITLNSGGQIDVSGKGYPGAYFSWIDATHSIDTKDGCNGGTMGDLVGADRIEESSDTQLKTNHGFGPGGGIAYNQKNYATGGGGSFAGAGKQGTDEAVSPRVYHYLVPNTTNLDWGSGGGAGSHDGGGSDTSCANGGAGGGIVDLKANSLVLTDVNQDVIKADGEIGNMFVDNRNSVGSGGGSGGVVRLAVNSISQSPVLVLLKAGVNPSTEFSPDGRVINTTSNITAIINEPHQISVLGGDRSEHNRGGFVNSYFNIDVNDGAGGGGGWIVLGPGPTSPSPTIQSKKIEVTVRWMEGTQQKTVKLYDVLRSVVAP